MEKAPLVRQRGFSFSTSQPVMSLPVSARRILSGLIFKKQCHVTTANATKNILK